MTKERARANSEPRPVQYWENRRTKGQALAHNRVFETHLAEVTALRQQQERYEQSLPKKPRKALADIYQTLEDTKDILEPSCAPRAAMELICQLAMHNALADGDQMSDAVYWLAIRSLEGLDKLEDAITRARDISRQFHPLHEPYQA
ncbi:hypothetical protein [Aestuariivita sp.]|jgi:hypothetical protein|uniref:hypothetical protein n=1 Tax=Aestuariivita sp. TaxID=1872407 RepID=UPI002173B0A9|nr:hypothetical protein [Aestuariivita sp.]MCE8005997.1 hypothetical protein [Aestuariivita sp.]